MKPVEVIQVKALSMQVCADSTLTDEQIVAGAEREYPCGTTMGWHVCQAGDSILKDGCEPRVTCADDPSRVHVIIGC